MPWHSHRFSLSLRERAGLPSVGFAKEGVRGWFHVLPPMFPTRAPGLLVPSNTVAGLCAKIPLGLEAGVNARIYRMREIA